MPNESDNQSKMHEPLQAYAQKRRQDAAGAPGMHPATKRMLLAEVEKQFGRSAQGKSKSGWGWLPETWPRWALGLATCSAIIVAVIVVVNPGQPTTQQMAKNEALADKKAAPAMAPPSPATPEVLPAEQPVMLLQASQPTAPKQHAASESLSSLAVTNTLAQRLERLELASTDRANVVVLTDSSSLRERRMAPTLSVSVPQPASVPPPPIIAPPAAATAANTPVNTRALQEEASVLANFEFQQSGDTVRVIDADGSVYTGRFLAVSPTNGVSAALAAAGAGVEQKAKDERFQEAQTELARRPVTARSDLAQSARKVAQSQTGLTNVVTSYSFQVRGTNLRSQQAVELDGVLVPTPILSKVQLDAERQEPAPTQSKALNQGQANQGMRFYRAVPGNAPAAQPAQPGQLNFGASAAPPRPESPSTNSQMLQRIRGVLRVGGNAQPLDAWQAEK